MYNYSALNIHNLSWLVWLSGLSAGLGTHSQHLSVPTVAKSGLQREQPCLQQDESDAVDKNRNRLCDTTRHTLSQSGPLMLFQGQSRQPLSGHHACVRHSARATIAALCLSPWDT